MVTIADASGGPHGFTANSFTSVSVDPPLVLVCIDLRCNLLARFQEGDVFAVNVLAQDQAPISSRFAELPEGRFENVGWVSGPMASPLLLGSAARFECRRWRMENAGDHVILIGEVLWAESDPKEPLIYFRSKYRRLHVDKPELIPDHR